MLNRVKNNFLGISSADKIYLFNQMNYFLEEKGSKKIKKEFYNCFNEYIHSIICFNRFIEDYPSFNDDYKRNILSFAMEEYVDLVGDHHIDNSPDSRRDSFIKDSNLEIMGDKVTEYVRYFKPDFISSEEVKEAMEIFECSTDEEKNSFIKDMCNLYSRLDFFSLSISSEDLSTFKDIMLSILSESLHINFEMLFPEEKMKFASSLSSFYEYIGFISNRNKDDESILKFNYLKSDAHLYR